MVKAHMAKRHAAGSQTMRFIALVLSFMGCRGAPEQSPAVSHEQRDPVWDTRFLRDIAKEPGPARVMIVRLGQGPGRTFTGRSEMSRWLVLEPPFADELRSLLADKASFTASDRTESPCTGAEIGLQINREQESVIVAFECGRFFSVDNTPLATASPALTALVTRVAAEVLPCEWQRLDAFDAELCAPAGARVSGTASVLDVSAPGAACPDIQVKPPDTASRQFLHTAGSLAVACVHHGEAACAELCDTIRPIPKPTGMKSTATGQPVISLSVSGGLGGGPVSRIAVWNNGTVELTAFRCRPHTQSTYGTTMSAGALATLLSRLKQTGVLTAVESREDEADAFWYSLHITIDDASYDVRIYGDPTSQALKKAFALISERVGIPRCS